MKKEKSDIIYVPAGLSSIFQVHYEGKELEKEGARGGGFRLELGSYTFAEYGENDEVFINGVKEEARTTFKVIELMRKKFSIEGKFKIYHKIELPIGCGFGTSASGALGTVFAIKNLVGLKASYCELTGIAHEADILALTGLGTVAGLASFKGKSGLLDKPGSPCFSEAKELEVDEEDVLVSLVFSRMEKAPWISSERIIKAINPVAEELLEKIKDEGTAYSLLKYSLIFAEKCGFLDDELKKISEYMIKLGFKGVGQNMIGRALHGLISYKKIDEVPKELERRFGAQVIVSNLQPENPLLKYI